MVILHTARLILRPTQIGDLDAFFQIMRNPRAMAHWSTLPHAGIDVTRDWMGSMLDHADSGHELVIERDNVLIGKAGGWLLPKIGYILHPDHWSMGYATEAMAAIIPHIWATSDVRELVADVDPLNPASVRVLINLGFRENGRAEWTFCIGGVWADSIYLALPRP